MVLPECPTDPELKALFLFLNLFLFLCLFFHSRSPYHNGRLYAAHWGYSSDENGQCPCPL